MKYRYTSPGFQQSEMEENGQSNDANGRQIRRRNALTVFTEIFVVAVGIN